MIVNSFRLRTRFNFANWWRPLSSGVVHLVRILIIDIHLMTWSNEKLSNVCEFYLLVVMSEVWIFSYDYNIFYQLSSDLHFSSRANFLSGCRSFTAVVLYNFWRLLILIIQLYFLKKLSPNYLVEYQPCRL